MTRCLNDFNQKEFLKTFWQQQPCLLSNALPGFISPITEDDLAGLAMEEEAEARIIGQDSDGNWHLENGPFSLEQLQSPGFPHWTLLIQAVDLWIDEVAELKQYFNFLPNWRLDDIMVSFAPEGGSVGPHFDYYDVFLIQAQGTRKWLIGQQCQHDETLQSNNPLGLLHDFQTEQTHQLKTGDILYVPPGKAHWGTSTSDDCLTISIGFRSPSVEEIASEVLHQQEEALHQGLRFVDQAEKQSHPFKLEPHDIKHAKDLLLKHLLNDQAIADALGLLMSEVKYPELFVQEPVNSEHLKKRSDARLVYYPIKSGIQLYVNGQSLVTQCDEAFIQKLSGNEVLHLNSLKKDQLHLAKQLANYGYFEDA